MSDRGAPIDAETDQQSLRRGFLPIETNWFDRLFIGVVVHVALNLFWMRVLESVLPLWIATVLGVLFIIYVVRRG